MLDPRQFTEYVIRPALEALTGPDKDFGGKAAEELLLGTAIQESRLTFLHQIGGPALGVFQVEPDTHNDLYANYLSYRPHLRKRLSALSGGERHTSLLITNLTYAAAVARLLYYRDSRPLPEAGDVEGQAAYWKRVYNTTYGKGTPEEYISNWFRYSA